MSESFYSESWYRIRDLKLGLHPRLVSGRHIYNGKVWHVLKDPVSLETYRFTQAAWLVIGRMNGKRSIETLWQDVVMQMGEDAPTQDDIVGLLGQLHQGGLLTGDIPFETEEVYERRKKRERRLIKSNLLSPMSFRVPIWNPDPFLSRAMPFVRPLLGKPALVVWAFVVLWATVMAGRHWQALTNNLVDRVLSFDNLLVMFAVYPIVKAVHELAHGFVTKSRGGAVHEMGIMFLVFFPVPYVDASAATANSSKYQRAAVSLAGIWAEVFLAALAMIAWAAMEPGFARAIVYNVMIIAGISTVLVNGNPLLKFDGYFALTDLLEVPNLADRANKYLGKVVTTKLFKQEDQKPLVVSTFEKYLFLIYAPAAFVYRLIVLTGIALFVAQKYFVVGGVLAAWSLATGLGRPIAKGLYKVFAGAELRRNRGLAVGWTLGGVVAAVLILFVLPAPHSTYWQGVVWLPEQSHVRTRAEGFVRAIHATPGARLEVGDVVAELEDPFFASNLERAVWKVRELEQRVATARLGASADYQIAQEELARERQTLDRLQEKAEQMVIRAEADGVFHTAVPLDDLEGRFLLQGSALGYVLPPRADRVRVVVGQADIALVRRHLKQVEMRRVDQLERVHEASILREVPGADVQLPSAALSVLAGGLIPTDPADDSGVKALERAFQFDVALPDAMQSAAFGGRVLVRFEHEAMPLGLQVWRRVRIAFLSNFDV